MGGNPGRVVRTILNKARNQQNADPTAFTPPLASNAQKLNLAGRLHSVKDENKPTLE